MIVRIIAVGQAERGDDAAGLLVAELLRAQAPDGIDVMSGAADAAAVLAQLEGADAAVAVDCARGGGEAGTILLLPADPAQWTRTRTSSHGHALADALALGEALGCLPPRLSVFVVVGQSFGLGAPISPAVRLALPKLARFVLRAARANARILLTRPACPSSAEFRAGPVSA